MPTDARARDDFADFVDRHLYFREDVDPDPVPLLGITLFDTYREWCAAGGRSALLRRELFDALEDLGAVKRRTNRGIAFTQIEWKTAEVEESAEPEPEAPRPAEPEPEQPLDEVERAHVALIEAARALAEAEARRARSDARRARERTR